MNYSSTRDGSKSVPSSACLLKGISSDGGLFVPQSFPTLSLAQIMSLADLSYSERAFEILSRYLTDFTPEELLECVRNAYDSGSFDNKEVAPLTRLTPDENVLELWHGPTFAFKDMALQLLPHLLVKAKEKQGITDEIMILVATSGDTGKAALEGFCDVEGIRIAVFFPCDGVSNMQKMQMVTQRGSNVTVGAIKGNFDDAQTGVKRIFADTAFNELLAGRGVRLSSANSINWGRLVPQIVYYISAYADLCKRNAIVPGDEINFVVPTGNFGNILAGYYAWRMGLPVNKFICASNSNNVLTDFINTGHYNSRREFHKTMSPSMDILISSNLERLLYHLADGNSDYIKTLMDKLRREGEYTADSAVMERLREKFYGGFATEEQTAAAIKSTFERYGYIIDTHTAVAQSVLEDYRRKTGDTTPAVVVSTASPFKFPASVIKAIEGRELDDAEAVLRLEELGITEPDSLKYLPMMPVLHDLVCEKDELSGVIYASLFG